MHFCCFLPERERERERKLLCPLRRRHPPPLAPLRGESTTESASAAAARPLLPGLPDEISIWEILVHLPPKCIVRCRAVCPAWRRATSARDFLLAHEARQPALPLLCRYNFVGDGVESLDLVPFDHRPGVAAPDQLRPVARLAHASSRPDACSRLDACCDGLLALTLNSGHFVVCNPATREYAALPLPTGLLLLGMYPHSPTGEYRLLLYWDHTLRPGEFAPDAPDGCYIFALGSAQPLLRHIEGTDVEDLIYPPSFLFRGSLHWNIQLNESGTNVVMVFDTATESLHEMRAPVVPWFATLFEMDGVLGMSSFSDEASTIDIWMLQDYESEVWALKYRVELPVGEFSMQFGKFAEQSNVVFTSCSGDVLVLVKFGEWLLQVDMDGKLIASFHCKGLADTRFRLKQTLVSHTFFGDVVGTSPFI